MTATVGGVCLKHRESTVLEGLYMGFESVVVLWRCEWEGRRRGKAGELVCDRCDVDG